MIHSKNDAKVQNEPVTILSPKASDNKITVGVFNIERFGHTKAGNPEIMKVLSKIISNYDVIAIQEIRNSSMQTTLPKLMDEINSIGDLRYEYIAGEDTGHEQYAYFYNTHTIKPKNIPFNYPDPEDYFKREPYIAEFKTINGNFDFVLINIHTYPDSAASEINRIPELVEYANRIYNDPDIIILGDLNADCDYFKKRKESQLRGRDYYWIIDSSFDTTTKKSSNCAYDRIIAASEVLDDYTGVSGVFRFDSAYNLSYETTIDVSDHYPVYANFWTNNDTD